MASSSNDLEPFRLRVLQHNMRGARNVTDEVNTLMRSRGIDVLLAQEPYGACGKVPGLGVATKVVTGAVPVMAAIAVRNPGVSVVKISQLCDTHLSCVSIGGSFESFYLISQYFQCREDIEVGLRRLDRALSALHHCRVVIAADVNARSPLWGGSKTDAKGEKLIEFIAQHDLVVLNEAGSIPTYSSPTGESWIDVTLVTKNFSKSVRNWKVHRDWTTSDHRAIRFDLVLAGVEGNQARKGRFQTRTADWAAFVRALQGRRESLAARAHLSCRADVESFAQDIEQSIIHACESSMRPKRWHSKSVPWWTSDLTRRKRRVNRLRRAFQQERDPEERAARKAEYLPERKAYSSAVRAAKLQSWKDFVTEQGNKEPWGLVYKLTRDKLRTETAVSNIRTHYGHTMDFSSTASALLDALIPDDKPEEDTRDQRRIRREVAHDPPTEDEPIFTGKEVGDAISSLKSGKCPGLDLVEVDALKYSFGVIRNELLKLYNGCLEHGVVPARWKVGLIRTILKGPDKPEADPKSYRPICLLSVLGKVLEKVIAHRLYGVFLNPDYCSDRQYGFRPGRSTEDAVVKLRELLSGREEKYVLGLSFDISGAFDNVWWPSVLMNLRTRSCSRNIYRLMVDYFADREVTMVTHGFRVAKKVTKGCPQGSILGPSCWDLVFDEVLQLLKNIQFTEHLAYADDLFVLVFGNTRNQLEARGQLVADVLTNWCNSQKLTLSATKTEMILLKGSLDRGRPPKIKIYGSSVSLRTTVRYLGVHFDERLGVRSHVEYLSVKTVRMFHAFARLARANWGLGHRAMRIMYASLFVPIVAYAAAGWADLLSPKLSGKLAGVQRKVLLSVVKAYRTVSTDAIPVIAGVLPIDLAIAERACVYNARKTRDIEFFECYISHNDLESGAITVAEAIAEVRREALAVWQRRWSASTKGRTTFRFFKNVSDRLDVRWLTLDHYVVQFLSGHGDFRAKLYGFALVPDDRCRCGETETSSHVLFDCPRHREARALLRQTANSERLAWPVEEADLVENERLYREFRRFARTVLQTKASRTHNATDLAVDLSEARTPTAGDPAELAGPSLAGDSVLPTEPGSSGQDQAPLASA